jgi:hypothetical protein
MALSFVTPEWIQSGDAGDYILNSRHVPYKMLVPAWVMHAARPPKRQLCVIKLQDYSLDSR